MKKRSIIKNVIKDHRVGALTASSKYTIRAMLKRVKGTHRYIVEYGAGNGVITKKMLDLLPKDGTLIAIETNNELLKELNAITDPRLKVVHGDVVPLSKNLLSLGIPSVDLVVSGIPFSFFKPDVRRQIVANTYEQLSPGGTFLVYQFSPLILPILKKYFKKIQLYYEVRNLFPYFIMVAEK